MQHFSNYFVQILVIRSKRQGGKMVQEGEKIPGGLPPTSRTYESCSKINESLLLEKANY